MKTSKLITIGQFTETADESNNLFENISRLVALDISGDVMDMDPTHGMEDSHIRRIAGNANIQHWNDMTLARAIRSSIHMRTLAKVISRP